MKLKMICIIIAIAIVFSAIPTIAENDDDNEKIYTGPKEIYDIKKGKPSNPGQGNKPPKDDSEPDPAIDKWAIVIGISDYRGKQYDLNYCDDDAQDVYNYLIGQGYPEGNIKLLVDAKARKIVDAIDWLNSWEGVESEIVFFYSGHGTTYDGYDDGDIEYTDEAIISSDLYLILDGQLEQMFSTFESEKISFIFDCCFAGGMDDLTEAGRIIVTACDENEYSYETSEKQNGVFTYYFVDGLNIYNIIEDAFVYAAPKTHNDCEDMNPQIFDLYPDKWNF